MRGACSADGLRASPTAGKALGYAQIAAAASTTTGAVVGDHRPGGRRRPSRPPSGSCAVSGRGSAATRGAAWLDASVGPGRRGRARHIRWTNDDCGRVKGHGTENDFVRACRIWTDAIDLTPPRPGRSATGAPVSAPTGAAGGAARNDDTAAADRPALDSCFMDYRNADGSMAAMCGERRAGLRRLPAA